VPAKPVFSSSRLAWGGVRASACEGAKADGRVMASSGASRRLPHRRKRRSVLLNFYLTFTKDRSSLVRRSATGFDIMSTHAGRAAAGDNRTRTAQRAPTPSANRHAGDGAPEPLGRRGRRSKRVAENAEIALTPAACRHAMRRPGAGDRKRLPHYRKYRKFPIAGEKEAWSAIRRGSGNCGNCRLQCWHLARAAGRTHDPSSPSGHLPNFVGEGA
jgi:hypothetical protein